MKKAIFILSVFSLIASGCKSQSKDKTEGNKSSIFYQTLSCNHTELSNQFDIELDFKRYIIDDYSDSCLIKLLIKDKLTGENFDSILLNLEYLLGRDYENCDSVVSYSTGLNANREILDNYAGDIVIADLNFDGKDDIAFICGNYIDAGSRYAFFIQSDDRKFIKDDFLTDEMEYFPAKIDPLHKQLTTYGWRAKYTYQLDLLTNKWKQVSMKLYEED